MSVEWVEHKGQQILVLDYRGLEPEDVIEHIELGAKLVQEVPPPTKICVLYNFERAVVNAAVMVRLIRLGQQVIEPRTEKSAVLGVQGTRHILLTAYNRATGAGKTQQVFETQEEALDWLVSGSD